MGIALAFGALTLGAPAQKAAASLAQKNPTKSGINLAAPFWGNDNGSSGDFTNDGVDCSATRVASGDANKIKDTMKKLTALERHFRVPQGVHQQVKSRCGYLGHSPMIVVRRLLKL